MEDLDSSSLEPTHKVQKGIAYPRHDPLQHWNEMKLILGMGYDHPKQLKLALANYEVAGRCAWYNSKRIKAKKLFPEAHDDAKKGKKPTKKTVKKKGNLSFKVNKVKTRSSKPKLGEGTRKDGEGSSRNSDVSPKWTKAKIASARKIGQPLCGFRLWASLIGTENSFQIKSLKLEDKGELLTTIQRDANNQMYPIAWAVVKVEDNENCWYNSGTKLLQQYEQFKPIHPEAHDYLV
ncbi:hypothetical protein Tco_0632344 [Tanacetum coccineum]